MSDHRSKAEEILGASRDWSDTRNQPHAAGQDALTHAVLALVEQQRIANLIALVAAGSVHRESPIWGVLDALKMGTAGDVSEGLGL
jgi:hypothetical protein